MARPSLVASAVAVGLLTCTACSGDGDAVPTTTAARATTTTTAPTTTAPTSTTSPTTTTTLPPVLAIETAMDSPGRDIDTAWRDGAGFIAIAQTAGVPRDQALSLVRIGLDGAITTEAPQPLLWSIFDVHGGPNGMWAFTYDGTTCGVQPIDPGTLALGPALAFPVDRSCGGGLVADSADPAVLLAAPDAVGRWFARVDTGDGSVTIVDLSAAVPQGYDITRLISLDGTTYALCTAGYDVMAGTNNTAPDGTELPPLLARIDPATGEVTTVQVAGFVRVVGGQLAAIVDADRAQLIDPVSLVTADVATAGLPPPDDTITDTGAVRWGFEIDDAGLLTVTQSDRATGVAVRTANSETGMTGSSRRASGFAVDETTFVVFTSQAAYRTGEPPTWSKMFRAVVRPAG